MKTRLKHSGIVNNTAVDNGQHGADLPDLRIRHGEVVAIQDCEVREFSSFNGTDLVFHLQKPAVAASEKPQSLLSRDLLIRVNAVSEGIDPGRCEMDMQPGIQRSNMDAVAVHARLNAMIDDGSKRSARRRPSDRSK